MNSTAARPGGSLGRTALRRAPACLLLLAAVTAFCTGRAHAEANLLAHWAFDDGAGSTAADSSGNGLNGTLAGNPQWVAGVVGGALALDGSGDYVDCGNILNSLSMPFTFTAWVKKQTGEDNTIVSSDDNVSTYAGFWIHLNADGSIAVNLGQNSGSGSGARRTKNSATGLYTVGTWFHLAVVVNGLTDMRILVDGLDAGGTYSGTGSGFATNSNPFRLGTRAGAASALNALIDDVRVYDGALTDAEIAALIVVDYPPQALGDTYTVTPDGALTAVAPGLLANDTDPNGATLTALRVSDPSHGTVSLNADGSFAYTPDAGYSGFDAFTYKVNDGTFDSATATVSLHVDVEPDQLAAHWAFDEGAGQLAQDSSGNGHTGEFVDNPQWGPGIIGTALELDGANDYVSCGDILNGLTLPFTFTAWIKKNAAVDRTIVSSDESSGTYAGFWVHLNGAGGVQISVGQNSGSGPGARRSKNSPSGAFTHGEWFHLATVVRGLTDMDILINGVNVSGTYDGTGSGFVTNASPFNLGTRVGDSGTLNASIDDIRVYDKALTETEVRSLIPNFAPEAADDAYALEPDHPLLVGAPGLLGNDTDFNGDALTAAKLTEPAHGSVTLNADGSFNYSPDAGYTGTDSFTYKANDGEEDSAPATVTFYIGPVTAGLYAYWPFDENAGTTTADESGNGRNGTLGGGAAWTPGVVGSGLHFDGVDERVLLNLPEMPAPWTIAFLVNREGSFRNSSAVILNSSNGSIRLEQYPNTGKVGLGYWPPEPDLYQAFNYQAPIGRWTHLALSATTTGTSLYVNGQLQDTTSSVIPLPLTVIGHLADVAMKGDLDEFRVYQRALSQAEVQSLIPVLPFASPDRYATPIDTALNVDAATGLVGNDTALSGNPLTANKLSDPSNGLLSFDPSGAFVYAPDPGFTGVDSFTYSVTDGANDSNVATVFITVGPSTAGLYAYWPFDENAGTTTADESGNGRNGTLGGGASWASGVLGSALHFDGIDEHVLLNQNDLQLPWTLAFFVRREAGAQGTSAVILNSDSRSIRLEQFNNTKKVGISNWLVEPDLNHAFNYQAPIDQWAHIALAASLSGTTLYVNGTPVDATTNAVVLPLTNIGHLLDVAMKGKLDEMRVYDRTLDSAEILSLIPPAAPFVKDDRYSIWKDQTLTVSAAYGVLANDTDINDDPITAVKTSDPVVGVLSLNPDGSFVYVPPVGFEGNVSFTYKAVDATSQSEDTTVTITVSDVLDGMIGQWKLNEATGTIATDSSGNGHHGTIQGNPVWTSGLFSNALALDGSGDYVSIPDAPDLRLGGDLSASFWIYRTATRPDWHRIFGKGDSTFRNYGVWLEPNKTNSRILFQQFNSSGANILELFSATTVPLNAWTHVAVTMEGGIGRIYINGALDASLARSGMPATSAATLLMGYGTYGSYVAALIDEVRLYSRAISPGEVTLLANAPPRASKDTFGYQLDTELNIAAPGVAANDADPEGDPFTVELVSGPAVGVLDLHADGSFTYTPPPGDTMDTTFTYRLVDAPGRPSNTATVTLTGPPSEIQSVAPACAYNTGPATLLIHGRNFPLYAGPVGPVAVRLSYPYGTVTSTGTISSSLNLVACSINLTGLHGWKFDVQLLENGAVTATLAEGFEVLNAQSAVRDLARNRLDGEFSGTFPSGDGQPMGNFVAEFRVAAPLPVVDAISFAPGQVFVAPPASLSAQISKPLNAQTVNLSTAFVRAAGTDGILGTADDTRVAGHSVSLVGGNQILMDLTSSPLPNGDYHFVLGQATPGHGLHFDGNDMVTAPDIPAYKLTDMTLSAWVRVDAYTPGQLRQILRRGDSNPSSSPYWLGITSTSKLAFQIGGVSGTSFVLETPTQPPLNTWIHLAGTFDAATKTMRIFTDGAEVASRVIPDLPYQNLTGFTHTICIGRLISHSSFGFKGDIDEAQVWNYARSAGQIQADRFGTLQGNESGLVGYWRFDETSGETVLDSSLNANNGLLGGSAFITSFDPQRTATGAPLEKEITDSADNALDGEFPGPGGVGEPLPSGDGAAGGEFAAPFTIAAPLPKVASLDFTPGQVFVAAPGNLTATLTKDVSPASATAQTVKLTRASSDGALGTPDDVPIAGGAITFPAANKVKLDLGGVPLPNDQYRLTLATAPAASILSFDGSNDYVSIPHSASLTLSHLTVEAWFRFESGGTSNPRIVNKGNSDFEIYTLGTGATRQLQARIQVDPLSPANVTLTAPSTIAAGGWHHVAITYNQTVFVLYLDGLPVAQAAETRALNTGTNLLAIGRKSATVADFFRGNIRDVRVWSVARSAAEIGAYLYSNLSGAEIGLAGLWKLTTGSGQAATDATANANHGTLGLDSVAGTDDPAWIESSTVYAALRDTDDNQLDGEFSGTFPSGNDVAGGDFTADFSVAAPLPKVTAISFTAGQTFVAPPANITVTASSNLDPASVSTGSVLLVRAGMDALLGTPDDVLVVPDGLSVQGGNQIILDLSDSSLLPNDAYRLHVLGTGATLVKDTSGNALDGEFTGTFPSGDGTAGGDFVADFEVDAPLPVVTALSFTPGAALAARPAQVQATIAPVVHPGSAHTGTVRLVRAGADGTLGTSDDVAIQPTSVEVTGGTVVSLNLANAQLPNDDYRLVMGAGLAHGALLFDGGDRIAVPDNAAYQLTDLTISAWARPDQLSGTQRQILFRGDDTGGNDPWWIGVNSANQIVFQVGTQDGVTNTVLAPVLPTLNAWTHIAGTFNSATKTMRLYVNGVEVANKVLSFLPITALTGANPGVGIGSLQTSAGQRFVGAIDEVRIWNHARTSAEIQADRLRILGGAEPGLVGYWRFDEGTGQVAQDSSSTKNNGVFGASVSVASDDPARILSIAPLAAQITDLYGNALDGEFGGTLPSGNGTVGGDFVADFSIDAPLPTVTALSFTPGQAFTTPPRNFTATVGVSIAQGTVSGASVRLTRAGTDGTLGTSDDVLIAPSSMSVQSVNQIALDYWAAVLPNDSYRLTILGTGANPVADEHGNALDGEFSGTLPSGDGTAGGDFVADFTVGAPLLKVTATSFVEDEVLSVMPTQLLATHSKNVHPASVNVGTVRLTRAGADGTLGTADDVAETPAAVEIIAGNQIKLDLTGIPLPNDAYRLTLSTGAPRLWEPFQWSSPSNVLTLNSSSTDMPNWISPDGLTIYFDSDRPGGQGNNDIYRATRDSLTVPWNPPALVPELNSNAFDGYALLSDDELSVLITSTRSGGVGDSDIWMSTRASLGDTWRSPTNAPELNSTAWDGMPLLSSDKLTLWFASQRSGGLGNKDIWVTSRASVGAPWATPVNVPELNSSSWDGPEWVSPDLCTIILSSDRSGGLGSFDFWVSTRPTPDSNWGPPTNATGLNSSSADRLLAINSDTSHVWFASNRSGLGQFDLWTAERVLGLCDNDGNLLDGEFSGTLPSGDGTAGGDFASTFTINEPLPVVTALSFTDGQAFGAPPSELVATISKYVQPSSVNAQSVQLLYAGADGTFGTADDLLRGPLTLSLTGGKQVHAGLASVSMPNGAYRFLLNGADDGGVLPANLIGYWKFDEFGGGIAQDSSGSGFDGTWFGPDPVIGHSGNALQFNGVDDDVRMGDVLNAEANWTVSVWVKRASTGTRHEVISKEGPNVATGWELSLQSNNKVEFGVFTNSFNLVQSSATITDTNAWYHVVGVRDASAGQLRVYVNGQFSGSASAGGAPVGSAMPLVVGSRADTVSRPYNGLIDELAIFNRALSAQEILDIYQVSSLASALKDTNGNRLDGEFSGTLPSGDGTQGGNFAAEFSVAGPPPRVNALSFSPGATLPVQPADIVATFTKNMASATVNNHTVSLIRAGADGALDTADDVALPPAGLSVENGNQIKLDLTGVAMPQDDYRLRLAGDSPYAWKSPVNVPELNTSAVDLMSWVSADELRAYLFSGRAGGVGNQDIWMTTRADTDSPWGAPVNVTELNSTAWDGHAVLTADELTGFFASARPGTGGNSDIWTATRASTGDPWNTPTNVAALNSSVFDEMPCISGDGLAIWFASNRAGSHDIMMSTRASTGDSWGAPVAVSELNSPQWDGPLWVSADKLRMLLRSDRTGALGGKDIWFSKRDTDTGTWSTPVNVTELNSSADEDILALNASETRIWMSSGRSGGAGSFDVWKAERMSPLTDFDTNVLDGENLGGVPSGDGIEGGDFAADFTLDLMPRVASITPAPGSISTAVFSADASFGGHCYRLIEQPMTWQDAKTYCESLGGYLACVGSASENAFLNALANQQPAWIGLTDEVTEGTFVWVNGQPATYFNWYSGEPNNAGNEDYVHLNTDGTWNDRTNSVTQVFVCEFDSVQIEGVRAVLSEDFDPATLTTDSFQIERSGGDKTFGDGNETLLVPAAATRTSAGVALLDLTDVGLTEDLYRLRLCGDGVNALKDLTGCVLDGEFTGTFPSGNGSPGGDFLVTFAYDPTVPSVTATVPADDAVSVALASSIQITFSEKMDHASAESAFQIQPFTSGTFSWSGNTLTFQPDTNLNLDTVYSVRIDAGAKDWLGLSMAAAFALDFTTGATLPGGGTPLPAGVVKNLLQLGATATSRITGYPSSGQSNLWDFLAYAGEGPEYLQQPLAGDAVNMHVGATETPLVWTEFSDADGIWTSGGTQSVNYWAIFVRAPSSRDAKLVVTRDDDVRIWMDGEPDFMSLSGSPASSPTFNLTVGWHRFIVKLYNNSGSGSMSFKFANPDGTDMSDLFYTLADPVPPQVEAFYPEPLATDVPRWHEVYIRFTEPMDTTADPADVVSISGGSVSGAWAWTDRFTLVFTPSALWDSDATYTVALTPANTTDRAGHPLSGQASFSFTVTSDLSAPALTNLDVTSGAQGGAVTNLTLNGSGFIEGGIIHPPGTLPWLPPGAPKYGEHYYYFSAYNTQNWLPAQAWLAAQGGHLATPTTPEEDAFLWRLIGYINGWFGGYDPDNNEIYSWVSGEPWSYSNWAEGEPNNFAGDTEIYAIYWWGFKWNDVSSGSTPGIGLGRAFVGEFDSRTAPAVKLVKTGQPDIPATNVRFLDDGTLMLDLDLTGAALGDWDVVLTNPDGQVAILSAAFEVQDRTSPKVTGLNFTSGAGLAIQPTQLTATLNEDVDPASVTTATVILSRAGVDGALNTADDVTVTPTSLSVENGNQIKIDLSATVLPDDKYQLLLSGADPWMVPFRLPDLNTTSSEQVVSVSQDGLELFFFSDRSGGAGDWDLYTCSRPDTSSAWSAPVNISELNTSGYEGHPVISASGLTLYFTSIRSGGVGNADLWKATRAAPGSPWTNPVNITELNSSAQDQVPIVSNDELDIWFLNDTTGGTTGHDIYHASRSDTALPWTGRTKVAELDTNFFECVTWVSPDKLTLYMTSNRTGTKGVLDVWRSTRPSLNDPWTTPQNISDLNTTTDDGGFMAISADGNTLWISSKRPGGVGNWDILQANAGSPVKDVHGNALDGEFAGTFHSGDGKPGGHFIAGFTIDRAPVAHDMDISTDEDVIYLGTLDATDSSVSLTYSIVTNGTMGTASITNTSTGAFKYTPSANASGTDTFTFKLNDGISDSNVATVSVTINPLNDLPLAVVGGLVTLEDTAASGTMIALDPDNDLLTFSIISNGSKGTAVLDDAAAGTFSYTTNPETWGLDTITFIANDGTGDSNEATITIQIFEVNDSPVASDGTLEADEDVPAGGTLAASDIDSATLTYSIVSNGTKGSAAVVNPTTGAFVYTPGPDANGADSFSFKSNDGNSDSNTSTITVTIHPLNDAPVAIAGSKSTPEDTTLVAMLSASDVDADDLTFSIITNGAMGTAVITDPATGAYTYTPNEDANGTDTFTFKVNDGQVDSNAATITITIQPLNDAPIAADDAFLTLEDTPFFNTLTAADVDGDNLTYSLVSTGTKGTAVITNPATGAFAYAPSANQNGTDTFTFKVTDGSVNSNTATVTVTIVAVNDTPTASDGSASTEQDSPVGGQCLANDADGDTLTYILVSDGSLGSVSITGSTGGFVYTPNPGQTGIDSFTFKVNDGTVDSNVATITVDVGEVNHPPVASNGSASTLEDVALSGTLLASDEDGPGLFFSIVANGTKGSTVLTNALTGAFTYTPTANANGSDSFTFKAYDGELYSNEATIFVTIAVVNDPPVALAASVETDEDTANDGVLAGTDVEGDGLTYAVVSNGSKGTAIVTNASTGAFTYTPNADANGNDSFTFKANDGQADSSPATVSITIAAANDPPVAQDGAAGTTEDAAVDGALVASDTEGDGLVFEIVANGSKGTAVVTNASTGAFTYTPSADANGADLFTFKAFDGQAYSNVSTVSITIGAVNDKPVAEADALTTDEDTPYTGGLSGSDVENQPLTFSIVSNGSKGTAVVTDASTGAFTYTPSSNAHGSDSFTFKTNDGMADSSPATVSVTIHAVNDTPTSQSGTVGTPEDTPFNGTLSASDVENDGLAYTLVANGSKGTAAITNSATGAFTYTPNTNANGSDSFTFKVNDGSADSNTATVTVNISPVNDIPMASIPAPGPYSVPEGVAFAFAGSGIDIEDGSNLTYEWDWDDSTPNGLAQNPSHLWNAPGTYTVSLVVTDQEGMPSNPVSVKVTVTPKAGERDLYLKKGKFSTDWKAHNDGIEKDTFFVQGCLNPAGCNANLNGATFELSVEGISLGVVPLAKNGKGSAGIGHAIAKASLKAKSGAFSFTIKEADLRAALGLSNTTETGEVELMIEITVPGAGLDTKSFAAHAAFSYATTQDVASKGAFNYKLNASLDGYFFALKTTVAEDKAGAHTISAKGYVEAPGGASLTPAGDVTLEIGAQTISIPATSLTVSGGVISLTKGAHPDLAKFVLDTNKKQFTILTNALAGTGVPPAGVALTSFDLLVRIEIPTAGDPIVLETTVEILRSSPTSKTWKR